MLMLSFVCQPERTLERDALIKKELVNKGITVIANPLELIQILSHKEQAKTFFLKNGIPTLQGRFFKTGMNSRH